MYTYKCLVTQITKLVKLKRNKIYLSQSGEMAFIACLSTHRMSEKERCELKKNGVFPVFHEVLT